MTQYNSKPSTVASVVNLVRSQVSRTERPHGPLGGPVKAKFHYANLVADRSEAVTCSELEFGLSYSSLAASWHELAGLRQVCDQPRTCLA